MPELPEVEVTKRSIEEYCQGAYLEKVERLFPTLRWPIPTEITNVKGVLRSVRRRSKYLLLEFDQEWIIIHLGMSGRLKRVSKQQELIKHDHVVFSFNNEYNLVYHDPRRFGAVLWFPKHKGDVLDTHPLFKRLGVEPLGKSFDAHYLHDALKSKRQSIKTVLLSNQVVVGVGNIYASEALFYAKIHPLTLGADLSFAECKVLVAAIQLVLQQSIDMGGTTLKDFLHTDGGSGYYQIHKQVYGRGNLPCIICGAIIKQVVIAQRMTYFCPSCQKDHA